MTQSRTHRTMICSVLVVAVSVLLLVCCMVPQAHAATKQEILDKMATVIPANLMGDVTNIAKTVAIDSATGNDIMADVDAAIAIVNGRSVYELGNADSVRVLDLAAHSCSLVGLSMTYSFNPAGGADITLTKNGTVIAKGNTRAGIVRTGGQQDSGPWVPLALITGVCTLAGACLVAMRKSTAA